MKKYPLLYKIIGIAFLVIPTIIYLCFLVPKLTEEYNILMASGGVIGGAGYYGASKITDKVKNSGLYKTTCNVFTTLTLITIVEKFIMQLIFLVVTMLLSYIIYKIFSGLYLKYRRQKENAELAEKITQNIIKST